MYCNIIGCKENAISNFNYAFCSKKCKEYVFDKAKGANIIIIKKTCNKQYQTICFETKKKKKFLEFPGGKRNKNENIIQTAMREFMEESTIFINDITKFRYYLDYCPIIAKPLKCKGNKISHKDSGYYLSFIVLIKSHINTNSFNYMLNIRQQLYNLGIIKEDFVELTKAFILIIIPIINNNIKNKYKKILNGRDRYFLINKTFFNLCEILDRNFSTLEDLEIWDGITHL